MTTKHNNDCLNTESEKKCHYVIPRGHAETWTAQSEESTSRYTSVYLRLLTFTSVYLRSPPFTSFHLDLPPFISVHLRLLLFISLLLRSPPFILVYLRLSSFTSVHLRVPTFTWVDLTEWSGKPRKIFSDLRANLIHSRESASQRTFTLVN